MTAISITRFRHYRPRRRAGEIAKKSGNPDLDPSVAAGDCRSFFKLNNGKSLADSTVFDPGGPRRDGPAGFRNNYEFVVQISVFGLADNLAYRRTLLCRCASLCICAAEGW